MNAVRNIIAKFNGHGERVKVGYSESGQTLVEESDCIIVCFPGSQHF